MTEANQDIPTSPGDVYIAGDTKVLRDDIDNEDGTPKDLTGATVKFALAAYPGAEPILTKDNDSSTDVQITDASDGQVEVVVEGTDTEGLGDDDGEEYYYEIEVIDGGSNIVTVTTGTWTIHADTA